MYELLQSSFVYIIPLLIVALGALITERSGVTNIAMEGLMIFGAFIGIWALTILENTGLPTQLIYIFAILIGGVAAMLMAGIHAFASISMKADQIISATALNLVLPAFAIFLARTIIGGSLIYFHRSYQISSVGFLSQIPIIGQIFFQRVFISTYIGIAILVLVYIFLYKSKTGLRIRSCGENPHAADSLGINIYRLRYFSVMASGFFAGMGGVIFFVTSSTSFGPSVSGYGFLAIAVLIFGNWKPIRILVAAVFFGLMGTLGSSFGTISFLRDLNIAAEFYRMIPYIATLFVLALFSKNSQAPKAVGEVYDQSKR